MKLVVFGGGKESAVGNVHRLALRMHGNTQIVGGIFSRNKQRNLQSHLWWNATRRNPFSSLVEVLEESDSFDGALILTPPDEHFQEIDALVKKKKWIITEKPTVSKLRDAHNLREVTSSSTKEMLLTTYNYTGYPMIRELKSIIQSGELGKILEIHVDMFQEGFIRVNKDDSVPKPQSWRLVDGEIPTVSLDLGSHVVHLTKYLTNLYPQTGKSQTSQRGHFEVLDSVHFIGKTASNVTTRFGWGKCFLGKQNGLTIELYGTKGSASWLQMEPELLYLRNSRGEERKLVRGNPSCQIANEPRYNRFKGGHPSGFLEAFANIYEDFLDYFRHGNVDVTPYSLIETTAISEVLSRIHNEWASA